MNILSTDKLFLLRSNKFQKGRRAFKRSNSIRQLRGKSFQNFIFIFMLGVLIFSGIFIAIYTANYIMTKKFSENVIDIMGDMESVETYIISIHIRFSLNSVLMGLTDDDLDRRNIKQQKIKKLIQEIDILQSKITDLTYLFRLTTTSNILTDLKYKFFTADICALISDLKSNHVSGNDEVLDNILGRLKNKAFCESLIKNVLTKGSTSFAFDLNEIFVQWRLFIENNGFSSDSVKEIISSIDFRDINFSLPYVYAIGLYYLREMIRTSNDYFDEIRLNMIIWFIFAILASLAIFLGPLQLLTKYLSIMLFRNIALIRLFPFTMIGNNKMLENKITRMFRLQKI